MSMVDVCIENEPWKDAPTGSPSRSETRGLQRFGRKDPTLRSANSYYIYSDEPFYDYPPTFTSAAQERREHIVQATLDLLSKHKPPEASATITQHKDVAQKTDVASKEVNVFSYVGKYLVIGARDHIAKVHYALLGMFVSTFVWAVVSLNYSVPFSLDLFLVSGAGLIAFVASRQIKKEIGRYYSKELIESDIKRLRRLNKAISEQV